MPRLTDKSFWGGLTFLLVAAFMSTRPAAGQNLVNITLSVPQYNQIYVADLDIEHTKSSSILFSATLQSLSQNPIQVKLDLIVNVTLAGESPFQLAEATSTPITLNPGQVRIITNIDLSGPNSPIHVDRYDYDQAQFDRIKNVALATGKAPAGKYDFNLKCEDLNDNAVSPTASGEVTVTNPSRVDLALPINGENVTTLFPHFQWSSNVDTVILSVYEKLPSQQTAEDVVSGVPYLQTNVPGPLSPVPNSFNYPSSGPGVRPLDKGKTYYWFVDATPSATRGSGLRK